MPDSLMQAPHIRGEFVDDMLRQHRFTQVMQRSPIVWQLVKEWDLVLGFGRRLVLGVLLIWPLPLLGLYKWTIHCHIGRSTECVWAQHLFDGGGGDLLKIFLLGRFLRIDQLL